MIDINIFRITEVEAYKISRQNLNYGVTGFLNSTKHKLTPRLFLKLISINIHRNY